MTHNDRSKVEPLNLDALRPAFTDDPHPILAELREAGPVHRVELLWTPVWLVTRYEDVRALFGNPALSCDVRHASDAVRALPYVQILHYSPLSVHMLAAEPPEHGRLRRAVSREFTPRRIEALRPRVQQVTDKLLAGFVGHGSADLIEELAAPLPATIVMELLGVPLADQRRFRSSVDVIVGMDEGDFARLPEVGAQVTEYLFEHVDLLRRLPTEIAAGSLLGALAQAPPGEERLTDRELASLAQLLLIAGYTTTLDLIGNGMLALLQHPEQLAALRADPGQLPAAVDELLRYDGSVPVPMLRFAAEDLTVGDTVIPAGDLVLLSIASANRDPARFDQPDLLDITRTDRGHVGFGHGIHYCLGAPLARLEAEVALRGLLESCPDLVLDSSEELSWRISLNVRGLRRLPVTFTAR